MGSQNPKSRNTGRAGSFCILHSAFPILLVVLLLAQAGAAWAYSLEREIRLGEEVSKEAEQEMPLSKNEKWQQDIAEMGKQFLPHITRKQIPYHFKIVAPKDENEINAFALPGGYVYFTERMWRIMTRDERAAVMAHEIIHSDHRHGIDMMLKSQQRALWVLPLIIATGGSVAVAQAAMWGNVIVTQRYSRKMEREADEDGIKLLKAAGFNPAGAVTSMKKLLYIESDQNRYEISAIFADHPETKNRIDYLVSGALALGAKKEDLELKAVDDPSRLGNITSKIQDVNVVNAKMLAPVNRGETVLIKKMLWDDDAQALRPRTVATATALTPGMLPMLVLKQNDNMSFGDVMPGDGVYPEEPSSVRAAADS